MDPLNAAFLVALLSGDRAVVIALAARNLPASQQRKAIVFGSTLLQALMKRSGVIITLGTALLGFVAVEMATMDVVAHDGLATHRHSLDHAVSLSAAVCVGAVGMALAGRHKAGRHEAP